MDSNVGKFWDSRFLKEGPIWGEGPSPTALLAARYARAGTRILDVGFGYGRDLTFLGRRECLVSGIDLSAAGRRLAEGRMQQYGIQPEHLWTGLFEDTDFPGAGYDLVVCHRLVHLLLTPDAVGRFARKVAEVLRPGGMLCLASRNLRDLNPADMTQVADEVYEYIHRPGHRIRFWDDRTFQAVFGKTFTILDLVPASEAESVANPVLCHLTVLVARKGLVDPAVNGCGASDRAAGAERPLGLGGPEERRRP
jgi:2-polyprenyl-3-methyl-5-hydroxy-6-metoxy-1,4-benzoquinol methylase